MIRKSSTNPGDFRQPSSVFALLAAATFLIGLLQSGLANAQQTQLVTEIEGISEYRCDNGVRLLLFPDDSKPQFTMNMTVLVGSRHEGYGETGMAHLLEHMLFKGTDKHPDIPKFLKDRGVLNMNGTTWVDRTNYYETLPANDDNLRFAIEMEADRLINSWIKGEDLMSEMTVVRNEFERGENSPQRILYQRIMSSAYEWHNYGKSTIGNRSDIERVPVDNLRAFYKKFYQPDNVMVVIAGKFDKAKALEYMDKYFGSLPVPSRELPKTYTEEPAQDGERIVKLRRVGDVQMVGAAYHIPSAANEDFPAVEVFATILGLEPSGPLYKKLVETKLASSVNASETAAHDPGIMLAMAEVPKDGDLEKVKTVLIEEIERIGKEGVTDEEVTRAIRNILKQRERRFANSEQFAINLSEWCAYGDWRLYFLHRDRLEKVTADDVKRVAATYCVEDNRTVGMFLPTATPVRAPVPSQPKLNTVLAGYKGRAKIASGESFEPTPENIESRTQFGELDSGIKYALLPKKTRGERVQLSATLHYGDAESLKGKVAASDLLPKLMTRGTKSLDFQKFRDRLDELKATMSFGGSTGDLSINIQTERKYVGEVLDLLNQALRQPALDNEEFEVIKRQSLTQMESMKSMPMMLAMTEFGRKIDPHSKDDVRYTPTIVENLERIGNVTVEDVKSIYDEFLNGQYGEVAIVGDFDSAEALSKLNSIFSNWKSSKAYTRISSHANTDVKGERITINTPDKKNAVYIAGVTAPVRDDDPDYEALLIGNYIMGGGPLSSRLADRVRKKEGLSYTAMSRFNADSIDERGMYMMFMISNPANTERVVETVAEEVDRMLDSGVTGEELDNAKESYLKNRRGSRANDARLAGLLLSNLETGRSLDFQQASDEKIETLSKDQVDSALKKMIDLERLLIVTAGDFESVQKDSDDKGTEE